MADYLSIFAAGGRTAEFGQYVTTHGRKLLMENFDEEAQQFSPKYTFQFEFTLGEGVFRVIKYFQRGTFGAAFLCRQIIGGGELGQSFCVKFMHGSTEKEMAEKMSAEMDKLETMADRQLSDHPNLIQVLYHQTAPLSGDAALPGNAGFVLMELGHLGEPLDYLSVEPYGVEEPILRRLVQDIFQALARFHGNGVIHRDLKPENLLLGIDGKLKLCDFGGIKCIDPGEERTEMSSTCQGIGSHMFNAPELPTGTYGKAVDFWSVAVVSLVLKTVKIPVASRHAPRGELSEMAYGVSRGRSPSDVLAQHMAEDTYGGSPSAALVALLERLFTDHNDRGELTPEIILQDPWFGGEKASDLQFAEWLVHRNSFNCHAAISIAPRQLLLDSTCTFYASLVGAMTKSTNGSADDMLAQLGLKNHLNALKDLGMESVADLQSIEESDLDDIGMPREAKSQLADAMLAVFGANAPEWCTRS